MFHPFERNELINLRQRAESLSEHVVPSWSRAYLALANAADHLDAMIARTIIHVGPNDGGNRAAAKKTMISKSASSAAPVHRFVRQCGSYDPITAMTTATITRIKSPRTM